MNWLKNFFLHTFLIKPEDGVPEAVAVNFRHNVLVNTIELSFYFFADSFWSINTILPVFAASLTEEPFLIGLIPAIVNAGWFLPQLFLVKRTSHLPKVLPLSKKMGLLERIPLTLLIFLPFLIGKISNQTVFWILLIMSAWRGVAGGFSALPWQELNARIFPISHRARYIGFSRVVAQTFAVVGSLISGLVLANFLYPKNYAIGFIIATAAVWISWFIYSQNREPEPEFSSEDAQNENAVNIPETTWHMIVRIWRNDPNFRHYLIARSLCFLGNMASAFLAVYAIQRFRLSDEYAAVFTTVILVTGILSHGMWGYLGDRIGPQKIVILSFLLWGGGLILAVAAPSIWVYYIVFALFSVYSAGLNVGDSMLVMELGEDHLRPSYLGMARTLTGIFLLLAPVLAGWLVKRFNYNTMFLAALAFMLLATTLMATVKDRPRRRL